MNALVRSAKEAVERLTGVRIYRNSLPHGTNLFLDINKRFGLENVRVVFDVGANVGQSAAVYAHEFPFAEIYSFEPVSDTYAQLVANTRHLRRFHPFRIGMGPKSGEAVIHVNRLNTKSSMRLDRAGVRDETIRVQTLADFAAEQKIGKIDFLKIDTEGFDLEVLAGGASLLEQQRIHLILSECQLVPRTSYFVKIDELAEFLCNFGYSLLGIYEQQPDWEGDNFLSYCNALFVSRTLRGKGARMQ